MANERGFLFPDPIRLFQRVDERLRNRCRFISWSEEHPAWAKTISTEQVEQLRQLLSERASIMLRLHDARREQTIEDLLADATDEQRRTIDQIQQVLAQHQGNENPAEQEALNGEISVLDVQREKILPFLNDAGVLVDQYGFAWIAKRDHYFRVNIEDTQVYLFSRDDPEHCARVCIVADTRGKDLSGAGFNTRDMLLVAKIVALQFDLLPPYLTDQIIDFLTTSHRGKNIFDFDPIIVFEKEFKERYPEIYQERISQRHASVDNELDGTFRNLRDAMLQELQRLRRIMAE
ncbi:MAG TPA: hypothetical protein VKM55_06775 [Candidatus Lokiarchaeia archaeon]|nr:hypothetical protein [Candidatus Lokiarchaeia archaeon]